MRPSARLLHIAVLAGLALSGMPLCADSPEGTASEFVRLAYDGRFDALPKAANAETEPFERSVGNVLRVRCVVVDGISIDDVAIDGDAARVQLQVALRKTEPQFPQSLSSEVLPLRLQLVHAGDRWLVSSVALLDDELAQQLLAADEEELARLLRAHPERMTRGLMWAIHARVLKIFNYSTGTKEEISRNVLRGAAILRELGSLSGNREAEALAIGVDSLDAWMQRGDMPGALRLTQEALDVVSDGAEPDVLARLWYNRGRAIEMQEDDDYGHSQSAREECYEHARAAAERAEDPYILNRVLIVLAGLANRRCDHLAARRYADQAFAVARANGDPGGEINADSTLMTVYVEQGDEERARFHHMRALALAEKIHSRLYLPLLIRSTRFLVADGRYDEARALLTKAMPRDERGNVTWNSVTAKSFVR
ncbi:MAG: tetratricopeptide repeat protein, partial [Thermoanaerobaculia bacterium]